jgi:drug/metabolite transporter (DMT)-like permease
MVITTPTLFAPVHKPVLPPALKATLAMAGFVLIYGSFFPFLKILLGEMSLLESAMLRMIGSGVLSAVIEFGWLKSRITEPRDWALMVGCGVFVIFGTQTLTPLGTMLTTSFDATLIMSTVPIQTALLAWCLGREGLWPKKVAGIVLGALGVAVLLLVGHHAPQAAVAGAMPHWVGNAIFTLNSAVFSGYMLVSAVLVKRYSPFSVITHASMVGGILAGLAVSLQTLVPGLPLPVAMPTWPHLGEALHSLSLTGWAILGYLVVLAGIVGYGLSNVALRYAPSSTVASYILLQPVWAAGLGAWLLHEQFTVPMLGAGGLTLLGVWLATRPAHVKHRPLFIHHLPGMAGKRTNNHRSDVINHAPTD